MFRALIKLNATATLRIDASGQRQASQSSVTLH
jgi:hypothetical protein